MQFNVISLLPEMIEGALKQGVVGQAFQHGELTLKTVNPRDFTEDIHQTVDDRPFGGGDGMVMSVGPLKKSLEFLAQKGKTGPVISLSPSGKPFSSAMAEELSRLSEITLICGRYAGVDQRFTQEFVDQEVSIGDYVLSGGELGALVMIDSISRFVPGVLGNPESPYKESFVKGLLEGPQYTRPRHYEGIDVPEVLLSGDHAKIERWRRQVAILYTWIKREDLLKLSINKGHVGLEELSQARDYWSKLSDHDKRGLGLESSSEELDPESLKC